MRGFVWRCETSTEFIYRFKMMGQWIQSKNNSVEQEGRLKLHALCFMPDWGRGKNEKQESGWENGGEEEEKEGRKEKRRKEGGERGDKRFIKVKQLWTTAKVVSTNSVCLFLDATDLHISPIAECLTSRETNGCISFVISKCGMCHSCLTEWVKINICRAQEAQFFGKKKKQTWIVTLAKWHWVKPGRCKLFIRVLAETYLYYYQSGGKNPS